MSKKGDSNNFVKWFSELNNKDISIAGGKGASLSEMYNNKFPIPPGFIVTAQSYAYFIEKAGLKDEIKKILESFDIENTEQLNIASRKIREIIESAEMPSEMQTEIVEAYEVLDTDKESYAGASKSALDILRKGKEPCFVAVRSSATTEDLADASFAGQQESFLNVKGNKELILNIKKCFSSLFTARAIYYRTKKGFDHSKSYLSCVVQKMINSDKSGVMFSKNPVSNDNTIMIEAVWGLGEGIVSGMIKPDNYLIDRNLNDFKIKDIKVSVKKTAVTRDAAGENKIIKLTEERANQQVLNNYEIKLLSQYALRLEEHYEKPQDIEFAISGKDVYIVQSRPITTFAKDKKDDISGNALLSGLGASPGVAYGTVKIIHDLSELEKIKTGDILVTEMTNPDMVVSMQKAAGIVTDEGGITSHAAIVSREMGIPAVVGTGKATTSLKDGMIITVDGNNGKVYEGKGEAKKVEIKPIVKTRTKIKVIVDLPDYAQRAALTQAKAVGLVRLEGIIAESGKHPMYFVKKDKMNDYKDIILRGLSKILAPFEEIWVRTSDIRSDEYRNLEFAPGEMEGNPMLGDHGIRFSLKNPEILRAEIQAIKELADENKDKKVGIMAPQIISVEELKKLKEYASEAKIGDNVKVGIMVETPAAVQIINELCEEGMQFVSFGTNDLTQYTLAIDRNNQSIQDLYNEMNPAVLNSIRYVIRKCKKYKVETSICGQAGSREDMAKFLVEEGIDSISVNADSAFKVSELVASLEKVEVKTEEIEETDIPQKAAETEAEKEDNEDYSYKNDEDMEDVVLRELSSQDSNFGEYQPSIVDSKQDIPKLNDSIPIDSDLFS